MDVIMGALNWYAALPSSVMVMIGIFLVGLLLARLKVGEALAVPSTLPARSLR